MHYMSKKNIVHIYFIHSKNCIYLYTIVQNFGISIILFYLKEMHAFIHQGCI